MNSFQFKLQLRLNSIYFLFKMLRVTHQPGSHAQQLENFIQGLVAREHGTPSSFAMRATVALGFPVRRQDVHKALVNLGLVRKKYALVPGLAVPAERAQYLNDMRQIAAFANQVLFTDEKKFKPDEFHARFDEYGYAPPGQRLPIGFAFSRSLFFVFCLWRVLAASLACSPRLWHAHGVSGYISSSFFLFSFFKFFFLNYIH